MNAPEWALGFNMDLLKQLAAIFKEDFKPHTYGAFGMPKENTIAAALKADELAYSTITQGEPRAAAIFKVMASASSHSDFSETQTAKILKGDLFIRAIAGNSADRKAHVIESLASRSRAPAVWVEAHLENRETVELLARLGFRKVLTKIAASSDIKGLFHRGETAGRLPGELASEEIPGLAMLSREIISLGQQAQIWHELREYEATKPWAQHYSTYNKRQSWTAFALRGYDVADPGFIIKPAEMSRGWKEENPDRLDALCAWTRAAEHFKATIEILSHNIPCRFQRVRLMRLSSAGGELTRHADITDPEAGVRDGSVARLHIPLMTSPGCLFRSWSLDGIERSGHFEERCLFYLDTRKPHAVVNGGETERVHLVIDAFANDWLRGLLNA